MDLLCLHSRKLGGRGALIVGAWKCQNWPMKVSKDQHLVFTCSCHRQKCDRGADAWKKSQDITHQWLPYQCWATCTGKDEKTGGALKFGERFFGEDVCFHVKEFRTTLICFVDALNMQVEHRHMSLFAPSCGYS